MAQETTSIENEYKENYEEIDLDGEVDHAGEISCALNEIEKLVRKNKLLKEELPHKFKLKSQL
jgi:hypothetical protein